MSRHPYENASSLAFWSKSIARDWDPTRTVNAQAPLVRLGENVVSAGSCFAANLVPFLERAGLTYLRTETPHPSFGSTGIETLSYGKFSAAYGNIYTARQIKQLLLRALGQFKPAEDRWVGDGEVIDPFRPGLRFKARTNEEMDLLTKQHLERTLEAFSQADVLIYTLGLTEAWESRLDGAVYPACPGTVAGTFELERHAFHNFSVVETTQDLDDFVVTLREINPRVRVILTVSPVPLVATATTNHVLVATVYSKSVLRVAAQEVTNKRHFVTYFPAFEIVTGPQAPERFFESTRRDVSPEAINTVMEAFFASCETNFARENVAALKARPQRPSLAARLIEAECEEGFVDVG